MTVVRCFFQGRSWAILCLMLLAASGARATTMAEAPDLKAAFVYNFTLFTTWPQTVRTLRICVLGDGAFVKPLRRYEGRNANGAMVHAEHVKSVAEARTCQAVFIEASEHENIGSIKNALAGLPVLTVAEAGALPPHSVHILLVKDNDKMAFDIDHAAASAAGLEFSFKLLKLARQVHGSK